MVFFLIGIYFAKLVGAGENQMLAGGAIIFFYGLVSAGMAFILALFIAYGVRHSTLIKLNKVLGAFFFLLICITAYKFVAREKKEDPAKDYPKKTTAPANKITALFTHITSERPVLRQ